MTAPQRPFRMPVLMSAGFLLYALTNFALTSQAVIDVLFRVMIACYAASVGQFWQQGRKGLVLLAALLLAGAIFMGAPEPRLEKSGIVLIADGMLISIAVLGAIGSLLAWRRERAARSLH